MAALGSPKREGLQRLAGPFRSDCSPWFVVVRGGQSLGNIPVYADLTQELEIAERGNVMKLAVLTSLFVVTIFALIGDWSPGPFVQRHGR